MPKTVGIATAEGNHCGVVLRHMGVVHRVAVEEHSGLEDGVGGGTAIGRQLGPEGYYQPVAGGVHLRSDEYLARVVGQIKSTHIERHRSAVALLVIGVLGYSSKVIPTEEFVVIVDVCVEVLVVGQREGAAAYGTDVARVAIPFGYNIDWQGGVAGRADGADGDTWSHVASGGVPRGTGQVIAGVGSGAVE